MKRTGSVEADQDSPRGFRAGSKGRSGLPNVPEIGPGRRLSRRAGSMGETIAESGDLWKSTDSRGSNESIASNASIPLPVPSVMPFLPISVLNIDKQLIFKTQIVPFSQEFLTVPAMVNVSSTKSL